MSDIHLIVSRQVKRWNMENDVYEKARQEDQSIMARPSDNKPVVTVSRQRGCRGHELGKLLAHELQYGLFDRKIVDYIAKHIGIRSELVESLDEKNRSKLELWIKNLVSEKVFDHDEYIKSLGEAIKALAIQGGVVVVGRGSNFLLANTPAFHLRVVAPEEFRIRTLKEIEGMSEKQATDEIKRVDNERAEYVKRYFKQPIENPAAYDMVINMATTTLDGAVKVILTALRTRKWPLEDIGGDKRAKTK